MNAVVEKKAEELRANISDELLEEMARPMRITDLVLQGCEVSGQAYDWSDGQENMCFWSTGAAAGIARGYLPE